MEIQRKGKPALLPEIWLVAIWLLLNGMGLVEGALRIWGYYRSPGHFTDFQSLLVNHVEVIRQMAICLVSLAGMVAGIGLLARARWARVSAVLVLGGLAVVHLAPLVLQLLPEFRKVDVPETVSIFMSPYPARLLYYAFCMLATLPLLFALLTPAVRRQWRDGWRTGPFDRWAAWLASRLPTGTALLALLFLYQALPILLNYKLTLRLTLEATKGLAGLCSLDSLSQVFSNGMVRMQLLSWLVSWLQLLLPAGLLLTSVGLLLRQTWARFAGFSMLLLAILLHLPMGYLDPTWRTHVPISYQVFFLASAVVQIAYLTALLDALARHQRWGRLRSEK